MRLDMGTGFSEVNREPNPTKWSEVNDIYIKGMLPYMEDNQRWMQALYQTVCSVENGSGTPEEVARMFGSDIENERKD